ncbi:hypothetical protein SEPCBS119000_002956 [Sporothrix epigloea]|uniref:Ribosomal protein L9 domain-containing protein n=1 Tax=Sporothrix epigloea TaxID=1892477 RepID=A0ABP0DIZ0_9PEZI
MGSNHQPTFYRAFAEFVLRADNKFSLKMLQSISASCLGCVARRLPLSAAGARPLVAVFNSVPTMQTIQTRGKKTKRREQGVIVRLLEDVTQYGRRDTILRVERGRMRNFWYPNGMAEYMTSARLAALGLPVADVVSKPDPWFVAAQDGVPAEEEVVAGRQTMTLRSVSVSSFFGSHLTFEYADKNQASRTAYLLETLVPSKLVFYRKPISAEGEAIFGSVSADDVATSLREVLQASGEEDALLVRVEPRDVKFVVPEAEPKQQDGDEQSSTVDRIKALGRWEVEIVVHGSQSSSTEPKTVEPVRKTVEVVATQE